MSCFFADSICFDINEDISWLHLDHSIPSSLRVFLTWIDTEMNPKKEFCDQSLNRGLLVLLSLPV